MRCKSAQAALSARLDSALPPEEEGTLLDHVAGCPSCQTIQHRLLELRRRLRVEPLGQVPDVAPRVLAELRRRTATARPWPVGRIRRPWLRPVAVAFAAGVVAGAAFIGLNPRRPAQVVAADIDAEVLAAQRHVSTLSADVTIAERGWHPRVPLRTFEGTLRYQAPESLALQLVDRTHYPSAAWRRNDISVVVAEDRWWSSGFPACPVALEPSCEPPAPRQRAVINREPFALDSPSGLDLVVPVASFDIPTAPSTLPSRQVSGRPAIGVETTVAQLAPLLSGLQQAGNWRELFPADPVELWLDQTNLVPLALTVRAGPNGPDRARWAAERGYQDTQGTVLLQVTLSAVEVNGALPSGSFPAAPAGLRGRDAGFHEGEDQLSAGWPVPGWLPAGLHSYRAGQVMEPGGTPVAVRTWTDGRSWVEVAATRNWAGGALFGDLGTLVRREQRGAAGVLYVGELGDRVGIHGAGIDVVVLGSLTEASLLDVAASLGVRGQDVPLGWAESGSTSLDQARQAEPGLLVTGSLAGFVAPAVRVSGSTVTLEYVGAGDRSFRLTESPGDVLTPPLDPDTTGVEVRGLTGRYQPGTGELEWVEDGRVFSLRSRSLTLGQLVAVAAGLVRS